MCLPPRHRNQLPAWPTDQSRGGRDNVPHPNGGRDVAGGVWRAVPSAVVSTGGAYTRESRELAAGDPCRVTLISAQRNRYATNRKMALQRAMFRPYSAAQYCVSAALLKAGSWPSCPGVADVGQGHQDGAPWDGLFYEPSETVSAGQYQAQSPMGIASGLGSSDSAERTSGGRGGGSLRVNNI